MTYTIELFIAVLVGVVLAAILTENGERVGDIFT
jgi:hypothetical protein